MAEISSRATLLWTVVSDALDIPKSVYQLAAARHRSVAEWLCRPTSTIARYRPNVRPQGSFRYGTVVRPISEEAEYDLDHVIVLDSLDTLTMSQKALKSLVGVELFRYAEAHEMQQPTEHSRCWRLPYRDEERFHLDSLPCVPADAATHLALRTLGVDEQWALRAVSITDKRHAHYGAVHPDWLTSNPRGFARWFEARASRGRGQRTLDAIRDGKVEDVAPYEWRTPLQRSIQILKRHRDVFFRKAPDVAPISMIITNLATHAYCGETDLSEALCGIVERMSGFVKSSRPRVPNPTHPHEDYADKWSRDVRLEQNFWNWHAQAQVDIQRFSKPLTNISSRDVQQRFDVLLSGEEERQLSMIAPALVSSIVSAVPHIQRPPKPWAD